MDVKDGKASGRSKKAKKYIKENLEQLMLVDVKDYKITETMRNLGVTDMTIQNAISVSLVLQALHRKYQGFSSYL